MLVDVIIKGSDMSETESILVKEVIAKGEKADTIESFLETFPFESTVDEDHRLRTVTVDTKNRMIICTELPF